MWNRSKLGKKKKREQKQEEDKEEEEEEQKEKSKNHSQRFWKNEKQLNNGKYKYIIN